MKVLNSHARRHLHLSVFSAHINLLNKALAEKLALNIYRYIQPLYVFKYKTLFLVFSSLFCYRRICTENDFRVHPRDCGKSSGKQKKNRSPHPLLNYLKNINGFCGYICVFDIFYVHARLFIHKKAVSLKQVQYTIPICLCIKTNDP